MPKTELVDEESIRKEYEEKLEQKEAELSTQQDQLNKLMKTKAELTRKMEQMQEENQSVSKLRESMDQEMDEYRKQKNQILDERDDALRESRNLRKEMEEMKRTILKCYFPVLIQILDKCLFLFAKTGKRKSHCPVDISSSLSKPV